MKLVVAVFGLFLNQPNTADILNRLFDSREETRAVAAGELGDLPVGTLKALQKQIAPALRDSSHKVQEKTIVAISKLGKEAVPVLPDILAGYFSSHGQTNIQFENLLVAIGPATVRSMSEITKNPQELSKNGYPTVRLLGKMTNCQEDAVKALLPILDNTDTYLSISAAESILRLHPEDKAAIGFLKSLYKSPTSFAVVLRASEVLARTNERKVTIPVLTAQVKENLKTPGKPVHLLAVSLNTLRHLGPDAIEAIPTLEALLMQLMDADEGEAPLWVAGVILNIQPTNKASLSYLEKSADKAVALLNSRARFGLDKERQFAMELLLHSKPFASQVLPKLRGLQVSNQDPEFQQDLRTLIQKLSE